MDMNQLFHDHQIALIAAARAKREGRRLADFDRPDHFARRIDAYRSRRGLPDYFPRTPTGNP